MNSGGTTPPPAASTYVSTVISAGDGGYASYRIPAIVKAPNGNLLAFVEGRLNSSADFGDVKIFEKISTDNGKTWGNAILAAQNGNLQADNATPVVDYTDPKYPQGRVFLFYCTGNNTQANVENLQGVREVWYTTSTDSGQTWSAPVNITLQVHHPYQPQFNPAYTDPLKWTAYATGPGHALQMTQGAHQGRIVVPINHGIFASHTNFAAAFYTDDHGKTFHLSPDVSIESDETTAAELTGGGVLLNSRDQYTGMHQRILSYDITGNLDASTQWQSGYNATLTDPECEGSMLNYTNAAGQQILLFSNPTSPQLQRAMVGIRQSFDQGKTWTQPDVVDEGSGAYSDLVGISNTQIGIIYEAGNYSTIRFVAVNYNDLPTK